MLDLPSYAVTQRWPDDPPNLAPVDDLADAPLLERKWWLKCRPIPLIDDFLSEDVVYTMCAYAAVSGVTVDATAVLLQEDPETGLQMPADVQYRGLAVLFVEEQTGLIVCANPASSNVTYLPVSWLTYLRLDPFPPPVDDDFPW